MPALFVFSFVFFLLFFLLFFLVNITDWRAKVADLGLSREIISHKAGNYTVCGTPCWVAPEIFRGEDYGWQVDVYSFAIVVWEILAGEKPFRGVSLLDLPDLVARRCQRPDILLIKVLPRDLKLLMAAMWANNPGRSYLYEMNIICNFVVFLLTTFFLFYTNHSNTS